jgi:hypothetical protein
MSTDTTMTMPSAIDSRNDVFITDHGSIRVIRSRARRPGLGAAAAFWAAAFCASFSARLSRRLGFGGRDSLAGLADLSFVGSATGSGATTGGGAAAGRAVSVVRADGDWEIVDCVAGLGCGAAAGGAGDVRAGAAAGAGVAAAGLLVAALAGRRACGG